MYINGVIVFIVMHCICMLNPTNATLRSCIDNPLPLSCPEINNDPSRGEFYPQCCKIKLVIPW